MYDVVVPRVDHLNCKQMAEKLVLAMPWMEQKEASELAWRIYEHGEAAVFTTTDKKNERDRERPVVVLGQKTSEHRQQN